MIINSQRTMYGLNLAMNQLIGKPHKELLNTTLNEKFGILPLEDIPEGTYPILNYITIGVGGTDIIDNSAYRFSKHKSIDAALFEHIPFVLRTLDNDILEEDKYKYRFRKIVNINGTDYIAYFIKIFTGYTCRDGLYEIESINDVHTLKIMNTNNPELLNPVPRLVENYLDVDNRKYNAKTVKVEFALNSDDLAEIENAMNIIYGGTKPISEIGLCTGLDKQLEGGGVEATNVVINYFVEVNIDTTMYILSNETILRTIEIGSLELNIN